MSLHPTRHAVVVGASVAGLAAARVLSDRFDEVTVLEGRRLPPGGEPASIAPQGRFPHVLLAAGSAALDRLEPGFVDELVARGAVAPSVEMWGRWRVASGLRLRGHGDVVTPMCSRALVESTLRDRVAGRANVRIVDGFVARALRADAGRVTGVIGDDGEVAADLVVDASGRGSRADAWLRGIGYPEPRTSEVVCDVTYTSVRVRRSASDLDGANYAVVQNSRDLARIAVVLPAEGPRWDIVLGGYFGDRAEPTAEGVWSFARSLPDDAVVRVLGNEWLTEPAVHRFRSSRRRHFEKLRAMPAGFVVLGDAVASFNPLYGQGMSSAVLQALQLGAMLDRHGNTARMPRTVARAAARVVANPWQIATGADFVYPQTTGPKAPGADLVNRYMDRVLHACTVDPVVNVAMTRVQHLLAAPSSLMAPAIVRRVVRARRLTPATDGSVVSERLRVA